MLICLFEHIQHLESKSCRSLKFVTQTRYGKISFIMCVATRMLPYKLATSTIWQVNENLPDISKFQIDGCQCATVSNDV